MSADRPINADVPSGPDPDADAPSIPEPAEEAPGSPSPEPEAAAPTTKPGPSEPEPEDAAPPPSEPEPPAAPVSSALPPPRRGRRRRRKIPGPIKLVAALVLLAVGFIVLAIAAGSGGGSGDKTTTATVTTTAGAAPVPAPQIVPDEGGGGSAGDEEAAEAPTTSAEELGYPGFATDNTTRVGGTDPATVAAASALAVFPSTTPKQRPAAVAIVPEEPVYAIPAAVLMAPPVRAPLLFSTDRGLSPTTEELPPTTVAALEALGPAGSGATGGVSVFTVDGAGNAKITTGGKTEGTEEFQARPTPTATVVAIARMREKAVGTPPDAYLLAPLGEPEIAAPAAAWAARSGDPVLDAGGDELSPETAALLGDHPQVPVFALGPKSSISDKLLTEVEKIGNPVKRVAGEDPVANALAFARYGSGKFGWDVNDPGHGFVLARAEDPLAAAAASALSASGTWGPLLLTDSAGTLPGEVREYFLDVKPGYTDDPTRAFYNHVWVIGDQGAIDVGQQAEVNELAELAQIGGGSE